ncbi:uncharacterized protein BKA78DRAFT_145319 [Phyllosticta capitalensis]|uniref:Uncharacterized protein n=1 Tax=Phyllosticta capitalensis TaxID=121624 RepID=A0ABR1YN67_9PEZI
MRAWGLLNRVALTCKASLCRRPTLATTILIWDHPCLLATKLPACREDMPKLEAMRNSRNVVQYNNCCGAQPQASQHDIQTGARQAIPAASILFVLCLWHFFLVTCRDACPGPCRA